LKFFLGTHEPQWLHRHVGPFFISAIRLRRRRTDWPKAIGKWALDSGGFSELAKHGRWSIDAKQYAAEVGRWRSTIGGMEWAAIQDWMCEPIMLKKTGFSVLEHQMRTIQSYNDLRGIAPGLPWVPVLQGWEHDDYIQHFWLYQKYAGCDLTTVPLVGVGSVCRRHNTDMAENLIRELCGLGVRVHGFGFKTEGLRRCEPWLTSADSLAWSFRARKSWNHDKKKLCARKDHRGSCANCYPWADEWRSKVLQGPKQLTLW
jgi:hypothetical protein